MRTRLGPGLALGLAFVLGLAAPASATNFRIYGYGARAIAMGGAMTAHVDDQSAPFYNPAGLVGSLDTELVLGFQFVDVDVSASNPSPIPEGSVRSSDAFPIDDTFGSYGGVKLIVPLGAELADRIGFGFALYSGFPSSVNTEIPFGFVPQYTLLNGPADVLTVQPAFGIRLLDELRIGLGAAIFADIGGNLEIPTGVRGSDGVNDAATVIDQEVQPIVRGVAGLQLDGGLVSPSLEPFSFGVTWRDAFSIPLQIPVTVLLGPIPLNIDVLSNLLYTPQQVTMGWSYRDDDLTVAVDLAWQQWSKYKAPTLQLALDVAIPVVPVDLKDAVNGDPGTKDTWVPRLGVEWRAYHDRDTETSLWLRGGYAYQPTPFPEQRGNTSYLDTDRHVFGAGVGLALNELPVWGALEDEVVLDLGVQWNYFESRVHRKDRINPLFVVDDDPLGFPPIEDDQGRPIADPGYPTIEGDANVVVIMLTSTIRFGGEEDR